MRTLKNHDSPAAIDRFLREEGLAPSRRFGQNFLVNPKVRRRIVELLDISPDHAVWEVGPGLGAMSETLAGECAKLTLFEIDRRFASYLRGVFSSSGQAGSEVEVVEGDVLKTWELEEKRSGRPDRILGNLPYNAASQIIASFLERDAGAGRMVFTVQKEVGQRMMANPGGEEYSSFSVLCGLYADVYDGGDVAAGSFHPVPRVVSKIVAVEPHERYGREVRAIAVLLARDAFGARRKTLRNALKSGRTAGRFGFPAVMDALNAAGIDPGLRGEKLSIEDYAAVAGHLDNHPGNEV